MIILLADDERIVRLGLKSMLLELPGEKHILLEARNGAEMCTICEKYTPDLAFVDIKMPEMDGVTAIRRCKERCANTVWVLLSGISDFSAAVNAIQLNVRDYLLKPIEFEQLRSIVESVEEGVKSRLAQKNIDFELHMVSFFNTAGILGQDSFPPVLALPPGWQYLTIVVLQEESESHESARFDRCFLDCFQARLKPHLAAEWNMAGFYLNSGELCIIVRLPVGSAPLIGETAKMALQELRKAGGMATTFLFRSGKGISDLYARIERLHEIAPLRCLLGLERSYDAEDLTPEALPRFAGEFSRLVCLLCDAYLDRDASAFKKSLEALVSQNDYKRFYQGCEDKQTILRYIKRAMKADMDGESFERLAAGFFQCLERLPPEGQPGGRSDIVTQIKAYVNQNYLNDVSIASVAERFDITPTYLSRIFHQKNGVKFIDYVTEVRIENAMRILQDNPDILVKDVAVMVGYYSARHFTRLFSKQCGMYPSDYAKQFLVT